jgi:hypothetical protein
MGQLGVGCAALVAVVFGFAAAGKLRDRGAWADFVATTRQMAPGLPARPAAVAVVGGEVVTTLLAIAAIALRDNVVEALAFLGAGALLASFVSGIARVLRAGTAVRCRCFGSTGAVFGRTHLVRNGFLLLVAATGLAASLVGDAVPLDANAVVAVAAGVLGGLLVAHWDELTFLVSGPA